MDHGEHVVDAVTQLLQEQLALGFRLLALGDVPDGADQPHGLAVVELDAAGRGDPACPSGGIGDPVLAGENPVACRVEGRRQRLLDPGPVLRNDAVDEDVVSHRQIVRHAPEFAHARVPFDLAGDHVVVVDADPGRALGETEPLGALLQLMLQCLACADILDDRDEVAGRTLRIADERYGQLREDVVAVSVAVALLQSVGGPAPGQQILHEREVVGEIVRMGEVLEGGLAQRIAVVAQKLAQGPVDLEPAPIEAHLRHADARVLEDGAKARFARRQAPLDPLQLGDLVRVAGDPHDAMHGIDLGCHVEVVELGVFPRAHAHHAAGRAPRCQHALLDRRELRGVLCPQQVPRPACRGSAPA